MSYCSNKGKKVGCEDAVNEILQEHHVNVEKSEVKIYDYVDIHIPLCDSMYRKRLKGYASVGYGKDNPEDSSTMRIADGKIANELIEILYEQQ